MIERIQKELLKCDHATLKAVYNVLRRMNDGRKRPVNKNDTKHHRHKTDSFPV